MQPLYLVQPGVRCDFKKQFAVVSGRCGFAGGIGRGAGGDHGPYLAGQLFGSGERGRHRQLCDLSLAGTIAGPLARMAGSHSYSASVGTNSSSFYPAADGAVDIWLASYNRQDTITASGFSSGVSAVGGYFFGSNNVGLSTPATEITVRATDAGGTTTELLLNPGTATFRGFVSTGGLTSLTLWVGANQGVGEVDVFPTLNDLTLAVAVPEPQSYALMLGGLALLGWAARRNKRG